MGTCDNCGHRSIFLKRYNCKECGKKICEHCGQRQLMVETNLHSLKPWYVCPNKCADSFFQRITKHFTPNEIDVNEEVIKDTISPLVIRTITAEENKEWLSDENKGTWRDMADSSSAMADNTVYENTLWNKLETLALKIKAQNLITARRFEEAAKIYETLRLYEKAGKTRAKGEEVRVRRVEVSVDLNSLLKQVKDGGLIVVYRCPHCSAPLKIGKDTNVDSLRICEHCGSEIETMDLTDFLRTALS